LIATQPPIEVLSVKSVSDEWRTVLEFAAPQVQDFLRACQEANLPTPEVGYELMGDQGQIVAFQSWPGKVVKSLCSYLSAIPTSTYLLRPAGRHLILIISPCL